MSDRSAEGAATGVIPQSQALAEVRVDSLAELFSRDPEGYSEADLDRVIAGLREQRARYEAAAPGAKPRPKATKSAAQVLASPAGSTPEEMGIF